MTPEPTPPPVRYVRDSGCGRASLVTLVPLLVVLAIILAGCGGHTTETVAVATKLDTSLPPPPIVSECDPRGRAQFPKFDGEQVGSNLKRAGNTILTAKSRDAKNSLREVRCFCAQVNSHGTDALKAEAKPVCDAIPAPAPAAPANPTS